VKLGISFDRFTAGSLKGLKRLISALREYSFAILRGLEILEPSHRDGPIDGGISKKPRHRHQIDRALAERRKHLLVTCGNW
jgi:hypothetical protein